jgi:hemerythrin
MEWDASLETGDDRIDGQHQKLLALFNELEHSGGRHDSAEVQSVLERLIDYVSVHFTMEEDLMRRLEYPAEDAGRHVQEHRMLTKRTRDMVLDFRTGALSTVGPLVIFLRQWLTCHVDQEDRRLVEHVQRRQAS